MSEAVTRHFEQQAEACSKMGSPFTAELCRLLLPALDRRTVTGRMVLDWPGNPRNDALALRLCGGLHGLVLDGTDQKLATCYPPAGDPAPLANILPGVISRHDGRLSAGLGGAPQTNEIARAAALYPGIAEISRRTRLPLALHEIGASAGLNLMVDQFTYQYDRIAMGGRDSAVSLAPEMRGNRFPDPRGSVAIASRNGCDIAPLHIADPAHRLRLRSYIWPDQPDRMRRLDAAIEIAAATPFTLVQEGAENYVRAILKTRKLSQAFVIYHSVMWQYLREETKNSIESQLAAAGNSATRDAPIAWLRMEGLGGVEPYATLQLTIWPGGETITLARCDFHCRWIEWLA